MASVPKVQQTAELDALSRPGPTMLCVTAGPKAGTDFPLNDDEVVIGRATDATLSIPDTSVSRKHAAVRRDGGGWIVADLGSGNGTIVNGEPISGERALFSGDVITLGDTEITFRDESNATVARPAPTSRPQRSAGGDAAGAVAPTAPPRPNRSRPDVRARLSRAGAPDVDPEAQRKKKKLLILGGVGVFLILALAVGVKIKNGQAAEIEARQRAAIMEERAEIKAVFQAGKNLAAKGDWTTAKVKFEEAIAAAGESELRPGGHPDIVDEVQTYLDRANVEIPSQEALVVAEKKLEENLLGEAAAALNKVSDNSAPATFDKKKELNVSLSKRIDARVTEARQALMNGGAELERARDISADVLKANANHRDAKVINEQAEAAIVERDKPEVVIPGKKIAPWEPAVARYKAGDTTAALSILDDCAAKRSLGRDAAKCKSLGGDVRDASALFKRIEDLDGKQLDKLLRMDRAITGGSLSKMGMQAGTQAGTKFCKMASSAKQSAQWGKAAEWTNRALEADPDSNCAKALMQDLRGRCKDTYMRGYSLKDTSPDEALPIFRDTVQLCGADQETRDKAKAWIEKIERGN